MGCCCQEKKVLPPVQTKAVKYEAAIIKQGSAFSQNLMEGRISNATSRILWVRIQLVRYLAKERVISKQVNIKTQGNLQDEKINKKQTAMLALSDQELKANLTGKQNQQKPERQQIINQVQSHQPYTLTRHSQIISQYSIGSGQSCIAGMRFAQKAQVENYLIVEWVNDNGDRIPLINTLIRVQTDMRLIFWEKNGFIVFDTLLPQKQGQFWWLNNSTVQNERNYPTGMNCKVCGMKSGACNLKCSVLNKFGGKTQYVIQQIAQFSKDQMR